MTETKKISAGQLMLLLLLARIMHTMIYRSNDFVSGTPLMLGLVCTTAAEALIALPAVLYFQKGGADPAAEIGGKFTPLVKLLYSVYFIGIASGTISLFAEFLYVEFPKGVAPIAAIIFLAVTAAYCANLGVEGLARAGTVVFWMFVIMFVVMATVSQGSFDWLNIRPFTAGDSDQFWKYVIESLSSSWWLPMLCALGVHLRSGAAKTAYGYLALKLVILEILLLLITLVLWRYVGMLGYPLLALGAYAKSDFIQRFDSINMLIWAINCSLVLGVYVFISSRPVNKYRPAAMISAAAAAALGIYEFKHGLRFDAPWFLAFKLIGIALLGVVIPASALIKLAARRKTAAPVRSVKESCSE